MSPITDTQQFIIDHRHDDVRQLAFLGDRFPEVDLQYALDQIQGWQTAGQKLPSWAACDGIVYPPHLNMEQCSSEATARYKAEVLSTITHQPSTLIDLTGGFGVDFTFLSQMAEKAVYVERNERLCDIARHNFACLGLKNVTVVCADATDYLHQLPSPITHRPSTAIFLDPARRDVHGRKVAGMADCTPDVLQLAPELMTKADVVMVKLSPMLDWHEALRQMAVSLRAVRAAGAVAFEVHIVSTRNECKELLLVMRHGDAPLRVVCVNDDQRFDYRPDEAVSPATVVTEEELRGDGAPRYLFVPNSSIMKAGCFDHIANHRHLKSLGKSSHLFVGYDEDASFPGRRFMISAISSMNKKDLKASLSGITQANIATRNFPLSVADLRKRLKLKDGGNCYIFATTVGQHHILFITKPVNKC